MKKILLSLQVLAISLALSACGKTEKREYKPEPEKKPADSVALTALPANWKKAVHLMKGFPTGIQVFLNNKPINGKSALMYSVVFDPKLIELKPVAAATNKKVSDFYRDEVAAKYVCMNGGFFGINTSYSLSMFNKTINAVNIKSLNRSFNGSNIPYYPTRAAFGISANSTADVAWIYHVGSGNGTIYSYPTPSPNLLNTAPQAIPSSSFPVG
ncbi:hypothetical protein, partial [Pedobacter sp.]